MGVKLHKIEEMCKNYLEIVNGCEKVRDKAQINIWVCNSKTGRKAFVAKGFRNPIYHNIKKCAKIMINRPPYIRYV